MNLKKVRTGRVCFTVPVFLLSTLIIIPTGFQPESNAARDRCRAMLIATSFCLWNRGASLAVVGAQPNPICRRRCRCVCLRLGMKAQLCGDLRSGFDEDGRQADGPLECHG